MAEQGLRFLRNLSAAEANNVSWAGGTLFGPTLVHLFAKLLYAYHVCPVIVSCFAQVQLMAALPCAQAAMDAHRGVAAVAENGLVFLTNLAVAEANMVSWWACLGHPRYATMRT